VPNGLRDQLAVGGRLIMPVGHAIRHQHLVKLVRRSQKQFDQQDLETWHSYPDR